MRRFLHVARAEDWAAAEASGSYAIPGSVSPSGSDPTSGRAGPPSRGSSPAFTHGCYPEQLPGVLARFYPGDRSGLVLLEVEPDGLPVRVEAASDGAGDFPHVYGAIPVAAVLTVSAVD